MHNIVSILPCLTCIRDVLQSLKCDTYLNSIQMNCSISGVFSISASNESLWYCVQQSRVKLIHKLGFLQLLRCLQGPGQMLQYIHDSKTRLILTVTKMEW